MSDVLAGELRGRFRDNARPRLTAMRSLLDALELNVSDAVALRELMRHIHFLVGMGATCGFPAVSANAEEGEAALHGFLRDGAAPHLEDVHSWRVMTDRIERELERD